MTDIAFALASKGLSGWYVDGDDYNSLVWNEGEAGRAKPTLAEIEAWHAEAVAPKPADVKAEAARRILAVVPEWKQRNMTARAAELAKIGEANWTTEQSAEWAAGQALWDQVKAIRVKSDEIEALNPIPANFTDDSYWFGGD
jgi:hypothetical protein